MITSWASCLRMHSPPEKKWKGHQLTHFGGVVAGSSVHKGQNLYDKLVDSFVVRYSDQSTARVDKVSIAQAKWRKVQDDRAAVEKFVTDVDEWKCRNTRISDVSKYKHLHINLKTASRCDSVHWTLHWYPVLYNLLTVLHVKKYQYACMKWLCLYLGRGREGPEEKQTGFVSKKILLITDEPLVTQLGYIFCCFVLWSCSCSCI